MFYQKKIINYIYLGFVCVFLISCGDAMTLMNNCDKDAPYDRLTLGELLTANKSLDKIQLLIPAMSDLSTFSGSDPRLDQQILLSEDASLDLEELNQLVLEGVIVVPSDTKCEMSFTEREITLEEGFKKLDKDNSLYLSVNELIENHDAGSSSTQINWLSEANLGSDNMMSFIEFSDHLTVYSTEDLAKTFFTIKRSLQPKLHPLTRQLALEIGADINPKLKLFINNSLNSDNKQQFLLTMVNAAGKHIAVAYAPTSFVNELNTEYGVQAISDKNGQILGYDAIIQEPSTTIANNNSGKIEVCPINDTVNNCQLI